MRGLLWSLVLALVVALLFSGEASAQTAAWLNRPPRSASTAPTCPESDRWVLAYWGGDSTPIDRAASTCSNADVFWGRRDANWLAFSPAAVGASDAWTVAPGESVFIHGKGSEAAMQAQASPPAEDQVQAQPSAPVAQVQALPSASVAQVQAQPSATPPPVQQPCNWSGYWAVEFFGPTIYPNRLSMELVQDGDRVTGKYNYLDGTLAGTVQARSLTATWTDPVVAGQPSNTGTLQLEIRIDAFGKDCEEFVGKRVYRSGETDTWSARRYAPNTIAPVFDGVPTPGTIFYASTGTTVRPQATTTVSPAAIPTIQPTIKGAIPPVVSLAGISSFLGFYLHPHRMAVDVKADGKVQIIAHAGGDCAVNPTPPCDIVVQGISLPSIIATGQITSISGTTATGRVYETNAQSLIPLEAFTLQARGNGVVRLVMSPGYTDMCLESVLATTHTCND